jgi:1,6-anhydro-N-acetylmuramate kinase
MAHYRGYLLDGRGKIVQSEDIEAISDEDAIARARALVASHASHAFELWRGRERLCKETRHIACA